MKPIYAIGNLGHVCVKIPCHGYEISIVCEDRTLNGNSLCTRTNVRIFNKDGEDVTGIFLTNTESPTLDTIRSIQNAILESIEEEDEFTYFVVYFVAENEATIEVRKKSNIWSPSNPEGWTNQAFGSPNYKEFDSLEAARKAKEDFYNK